MRRRDINVRLLHREALPARSYGTHKWDKYPAKMLPHLARYAIERVSNAGDLVLDPFCGCGTVQIECSVMGRESVGIDVNPVAVYLARAKSTDYEATLLRSYANSVLKRAKATKPNGDIPDWLHYWFSPKSLAKLLCLRQAIFNTKGVPQKYRDALAASLIVSTRRCSKADPRSPKPFISQRARKNRVGRHFDAFEIFPSVVDALCRGHAELTALVPSRCQAETRKGDARKLGEFVKRPIDAIVTSPPYLSAQDYFRSSKLELAISGCALDRDLLGEQMLGSGRGLILEKDFAECCFEPEALRRVRNVDPRAAQVIKAYLSDLHQVFRGMFQILKDGGECCVIVGDSTMNNVRLPVHRWVTRIGCDVGFELIAHEADRIKDRRVPPQREGHASVIDREHLLFFSKSN